MTKLGKGSTPKKRSIDPTKLQDEKDEEEYERDKLERGGDNIDPTAIEAEEEQSGNTVSPNQTGDLIDLTEGGDSEGIDPTEMYVDEEDEEEEGKNIDPRAKSSPTDDDGYDGTPGSVEAQ